MNASGFFLRLSTFTAALLCPLLPLLTHAQDEEENPAEKQTSQGGGKIVRSAGVEANPMHAVLRQLVGIEIKVAVLKYETVKAQVAAGTANPAQLEEAKAAVETLVKENPVVATEPEVAKEIPVEIVPPPAPPPPPNVTPPTNPGSPPSSNTYAYDVSADSLSVDHGYSTTTLSRTEATSTKLATVAGVDANTALTIPYLIDVFETDLYTTQGATHFNQVLTETMPLVNALLTEVTLAGSPTLSGHANLYTSDSVKNILSGKNPYYYQLVKALAAKNAFGDAGDAAGSQVVTRSLEALFGAAGVTAATTVSDLLDKTVAQVLPDASSKYATLLGVRADNKATNAPLFNLPAKNVQGVVGQNVTLGQAGSATSIDLTSQLKPSTTKPTSAADWKVFGIGAGKDLTVKGDITFTNANRHAGTGKIVKDHALAIGALDDVHFHSQTWEKDWGLAPGFLAQHGAAMAAGTASTATAANKTNRITVDFEGANLYLGSVSKLELVNVDLKSGGNLGVGSLEELSIVSLDPNKRNTLTVGQNTHASEGEKIQLYANERVLADGVDFKGNVDEIYMQARTVDLKNVTFPGGSEVILVSEYGGVEGKYPTFGASNRAMGRVNFIDNVKYDVKTIDSKSAFDALGSTHAISTSNGSKHPITINPFSKATAKP